MERRLEVTVPDYRRVYVRAWPEPPPKENNGGWRPGWEKGSGRRDRVLVVDTETTTSIPQRLLFGFAALCEVSRDDHGTVTTKLLNGWRFHADDLIDFDPEGYQQLLRYSTESAGAECGDGCCWYDQAESFPLLSQTEFLNEVFWGLAYKSRIPVVGFNLPFDLSMMARFARTTPRGDAFSFDFWGRPGERPDKWQRPPYRPGLVIQRMGGGHEIHFTGFSLVDEVDKIPEGSVDGQAHSQYRYRGHFWDLSQLSFSLTHERLSLHNTGREFSAIVLKIQAEEHGVITPEYIAYNRHDVAATASLFERVMTEFERHPVELEPEHAYSQASIGKAYLDALGVIPPRTKWPDFPKELLGKWSAAYVAGRSEMRVRHIPLPVSYSDGVAMFPTVCTLVGMWRYEIADQIEVVDWTSELQGLVDRAASEGPGFLLDPELWKKLVAIGEIVPDGDILPVRADYDDTPDNNKRVGVSEFFHDGVLPFTAADLLASAILKRKPSKIIRAWRLIPKGIQPGLKPVRYRGLVEIDPVSTDFYKFLVEDRYRWKAKEHADPDAKWLAAGEKILNNALSYGVKMEFNPQAKPGLSRITAYDGQTFTVKLGHPEVPGRLCFPPFGATITGGARLFMAIRERLTTDAGGAYYLCDTDSMAIISTKDGRPIPCPRADDHPAATHTPDGQPAVRTIPWDNDDEIRSQFEPLNPYDRELIPEIWKLEAENYTDTGERRELQAYGISAKRYTFFALDHQDQPVISDSKGNPALIKPSEHGLGALLNPLDPENGTRLAPAVWQYILSQHYQIPVERPEWLARTAMRKEAVSTPHVWSAFDEYNRGKPYTEWIKPFSFMMSPNTGRWRYSQPVKFVAPYDRNPDNWDQHQYIEIHTQHTTPGHLLGPLAQLETSIDQWRQNPEIVGKAPDGKPCQRDTTGLLDRRTITSAQGLVTLIGKEAGSVETEDQLAEDHASTHLATYTHPLSQWRIVCLVVRRLGIPKVAARSQAITARGLRNALKPGVTPRSATQRQVASAAAQMIREMIGLDWKEDAKVLVAYLITTE